MAFKRAEWHSGLTYRQMCRECRTMVEYMDTVLDFRPWYADGFVYCPRCKTPLRHNEAYAINAPKAPLVQAVQPMKDVVEIKPVVASEACKEGKNTEKEVFCPCCGRQFGDEDLFCAKCGRKRS